MSQLTYIAVDKIHAHPNNPRKDIGDITELADEYLSIIGHRRLAASKEAGLAEVPCIITEMDEKQQLATMLLENMQRTDLTVYEQAQGFQLMMDMGESVTGISDKTGFSESTVRRRMKLLELDADKFKESEERGASLSDYMELERIQSMELKNSVLVYVGTANFQNELRRAIEQEEQDAKREENLALLRSFATETDEIGGLAYVRYFHRASNIERPADADEVEYYFTVDTYGFNLYKQSDGEQEDTAEKEAKRKAQEEAERRRAELDVIANRAFELRFAFVQKLKVLKIKANLGEIVAAAALQAADHWTCIDNEEFFTLLGTKLPEDEEAIPEAMRTIARKSPERAIMARAYLDFEDGSNKTYHQWNGTHKGNASLDALYELLTLLGYEMSDEEKACQNGTLNCL